LKESFAPPQKAHRPIMIGSNAQFPSAPVSDNFGKFHVKLMYKLNELRIHYHDYHEFCFHNRLLGMVVLPETRTFLDIVPLSSRLVWSCV
jgi:hypothetical protein